MFCICIMDRRIFSGLPKGSVVFLLSLLFLSFLVFNYVIKGILDTRSNSLDG